MPGMDQTGPSGQGSMTGRKMGRCTNFGANFRRRNPAMEGDQVNDQGSNFPGQGLGMGMGRGGRGRGLGRRNRFRSGF